MTSTHWAQARSEYEIDRLEAEYAAPPQTLGNPWPTRAGVTTGGRAEIKTHTVKSILAGLIQLRKAKTRGTERLLLTYQYPAPGDTSADPNLLVYLLKPRPSCLDPNQPLSPPAAGASIPAWLDSLGDWYLMDPVAPKPQTMKQWFDQVGPVVFGSMAEPLIRDAFLKAYRATRFSSRTKYPHQAGADVRWREIAEYLSELASELSAELSA